MEKYKEMYLILWHGIEDALAAIAEQNYGLAAELLKKAHTDAEDIYISQDD